MKQLVRSLLLSLLCFFTVSTVYAQDIEVCLFEDINGDGLNNDGADITGATIDLIDNNGAGSNVGPLVDGGNGCYTLSGLMDGEDYCFEIDLGTLGMDAFTLSGGDSDATPGTTSPENFCFQWDSGDNDMFTIGMYQFAEVCGEVFQDCDNDGNDEDNQDFNGETVSILDDASNPAVDADGVVIGDVTVSGGEFCFTNLPPGDYLFLFNNMNTDFFPAFMDGGTENDMDPNSEATTTVITANSGDNLTNQVQAGYIELIDICGVVFEDCDGNGINDDGMTLDDVQVSIANLDGSAVLMPDMTPVISPVTPSAGDYCFEGVPPGEYVITFTANAPATYFLTAMDAGPDTQDSDPDPATGETDPIMVETCNGNIQNIADAGFYQSGCIAGTYWHDFNGDAVYGGDDSGMPNGQVTLIQNGAQAVDVFGNPVAPFDVDGNGDYEFCDLAPGEYDVDFILQAGYQFWPQNGAITDDDNNDAPGGNNGTVEDVALNTCDNDMIEYVDAGVYQEVTIGGTIWIDQDDDGTLGTEVSVTGISVNIYACGDCGGTPLGPTVVTDANGFAWLAPPGEYCIQIDPSMFDQAGPLANLFEVCNGNSNPNDNIDNDNNGIDDGIGSGGGVNIECAEITCPEPDVPDPTVNTTFDFCFMTAACDDPDNIPTQLTTDCGTIEADPDTYIICDINILDAFCGTMFSQNTGNGPNPLCSQGGTPHNITWFGFVAGAGDFDIEMVPIGCTPGGGGQLGMQAGIYTDCAFTQEVWCASIPCSTDAINTSTGNVNWVPGQTYYFFFDGCAGSVCDFEINVVCNSASCDPFALPDPTSWGLEGCDDGFDPCAGGTYDVVVQGFEDFDLQFAWQIQHPNMGILDNVDTDEGVLSYTFPEAGDYDICFTVNNGCSNQQGCETFTIIELPDVDFGIIQLCGEDSGVPDDVTFMGIDYTWDGNVTAPPYDAGGNNTYMIDELTTSDCGCEYTQSVMLEVQPDSDIMMDQITICEDEFPYDYDGSNIGGPYSPTVSIAAPGTGQSVVFVDNFTNGCNLLVSLDVFTPIATGDIFDLGCMDGGITVEWQGTIEPAAEVTSVFTWFDDGGGVIQTGPDPSVTITEGQGIDGVSLTITMTLNGVDCDYEVAELPIEFNGPAAPDLLGDPLPAICLNGDIVTYEIDGPVMGLDYQWNLVGGGTIISGQGTPVIQVDWTGVSIGNAGIEINVTDGCNLTDFNDFLIDIFEAPDVDFDFDGVFCPGQEIVFEYTGDLADPSWTFDWNFGTGTIVSSTTPDQEGPHTVVFTAGGMQDISLTVESAPGCATPHMEQINISPPLAAPNVICANTGTTFVTFEWVNDPGIDMYTYEVMPSGEMGTVDGNLVNSVTIMGLNQGDTETITIYGIDMNGCQSAITTQPCTALDCNLPSGDIDMPTAYCDDDVAIPFSIMYDMPLTAMGEDTFYVDGTPVLTGMFDPSLYTVGMHTISYQFIEDLSGCPINDNHMIEIFETPMVMPTVDDDNVCITDPIVINLNVVPLDWTLDGGTIAGTGTGPYEIRYTTPGPKVITVTSANALNTSCVSDPATINVNIDPEIMAPGLTCSSTQTSVTFTWTEDANATYTVTDMSLLGTPTTSAGMYEVTNLTQGDVVMIQLDYVSSNECPGGMETAECTAVPCPTYELAFDQTDGMIICPSTDPFSFVANVTEMGMPVTIGTNTWSGIPTIDASSGLVDPANIPEGNYVVSYVFDDGNNCGISGTIDVTVINPLPQIMGINNICVSDVLSLSTPTVSGTDVQYNWDLGGANGTATGAGPFDVTFDNPGEYTITLDLLVDGCQTNTDMFLVTVDPALEVPVISCTESMNEVTFDWEPIAGATEYEVIINSGTPTTQAGTSYTESGLSEGDAVSITVTALTNSLCGSTTASEDCMATPCPNIVLNLSASDNSVCSADTPTVSLSTGITGSDGTGTGTWTGSGVDQNGNIDISSLTAGTYTYTYDFVEAGCPFTQDIMVEVFVSPTISLASVDPDCFLDNVGSIMADVTADTPGFTISVNGGMVTTDTDFTGLTPGQYTLVVTDDNNCTATATTNITASLQPTVEVAGLASIVLGQSGDYSFSTNLTEPITDIIWTDSNLGLLGSGADALTQMTTPTTDGTICVEIFYGNNCMISDCLDYEVREVQIFTFSNIFTPNGDSQNDGWEIYSSDDDVVIRDVKIYDRWGGLVFNVENGAIEFVDNQAVLWDGTIDGQDATPGVYVYQVLLDKGGENNLNEFESFYGDITIIK